MRKISAALAALMMWSLCASAAAQAPSAVLEHYRAYRAALDANDLSAAEREAVAALAASEARDGDGGRTAVLALNLASVRILKGDAAGALAPAQRAVTLAEAASNTGVDLTLARLIHARARLASGDAAAIPALHTALAAAEQGGVAEVEVYDAAVELGGAAFADARYTVARDAWRTAGAHAGASRFPQAFAESNARTGEAVAMLLEDLRLAGRRVRQEKLDEDVAREAYLMLVASIAQLAPLAEAEAPSGDVTVAQRVYAEALAWRAVLSAKMRSDDQDLPETEAQGDGSAEVAIPAADVSRPRCWVQIDHERNMPRYPSDALRRGNLAGLAVRLRLNAQGEVTDAQTVALIGDESFARSVEQAARDWRATARPDSPPNCRMEMTVITSVSFAIGS